MPDRIIESREQLNACPTGTVIRAQGGTLYLVGETAPDGRLRLHPLEAVTGLTYYSANFDRSLPVEAWSPKDGASDA